MTRRLWARKEFWLTLWLVVYPVALVIGISAGIGILGQRVFGYDNATLSIVSAVCGFLGMQFLLRQWL